MAYSESVLRAAEARLAAERQQHDEQNRRRIAEIYAAQPRLREIDSALRKTSARVMAACFRKGEDTQTALEQLKRENLALQQERAWILDSNEISPDDLADTPICTACGGTGYVGARMCECLMELCRQEQKKELSSLLGAGQESFDQFRPEVYSEDFDPRLGASPRAMMQMVFSDCQRYAKTFAPGAPSLFFIGATGLGKTFLSACIAKVVAERGFDVDECIYQRFRKYTVTLQKSQVKRLGDGRLQYRVSIKTMKEVPANDLAEILEKTPEFESVEL